VHGVDISPDGKQSLSASFDGTVGLWSNETGKELKRMAGHTGPSLDGGFRPRRQTSDFRRPGKRDQTLEFGDGARNPGVEGSHFFRPFSQWFPRRPPDYLGKLPHRTVILLDAEKFEPLHRLKDIPT